MKTLKEALGVSEALFSRKNLNYKNHLEIRDKYNDLIIIGINGNEVIFEYFFENSTPCELTISLEGAKYLINHLEMSTVSKRVSDLYLGKYYYAYIIPSKKSIVFSYNGPRDRAYYFTNEQVKALIEFINQ